jgi:hypothetical protein
MEPIILELEREENDLLIIAHESVLRVLYGYLMACNAADIPKLQFPRDEIIEVRGSAISLQDHRTLTDISSDHSLELQQCRKTHQDPGPAKEHDSRKPRGHRDSCATQWSGKPLPWDKHTQRQLGNSDT